MKVYKIEITVFDNEDLGEDEVQELLTNNRHLNIGVVKLQSKDIGDWDDDHPLNRNDTFDKAWEELWK